jgi:hypothetical protein
MSCSYLRIVTIGFHADRSTRFPIDRRANTGRFRIITTRQQTSVLACFGHQFAGLGRGRSGRWRRLDEIDESAQRRVIWRCWGNVMK